MPQPPAGRCGGTKKGATLMRGACVCLRRDGG